MADLRWKRKARQFALVAEERRGEPEGDLARRQLLEIIKKHPEARDLEPVQKLFQHDRNLAGGS